MVESDRQTIVEDGRMISVFDFPYAAAVSYMSSFDSGVPSQ